MSHGIFQCKHGTIVKRCRCPNDSIYIVGCPMWCHEAQLEKKDAPYDWSNED